MDTYRPPFARLALLALVLFGVVVTALPAPTAALDGDSGATYTNPRAPGADGRYTVTVIAEENDTIVRNGLQRLSIDFGADRDFSGDISNVTGEDVAIYLEKANASGSVSLGAVNASTGEENSELIVRLESVYRAIGPGDRIVVRIANTSNTDIAVPDPQGVRSFALRVSASGPGGGTDGPVQVRYEIDPNATAPATDGGTTAGANGSNASVANGSDGSENDARNASNASGGGDRANAAGTSDSTEGTVGSMVAGSPTLIGLLGIASLGIAVLGVTYLFYDRREETSGGRDRL
ncbi:hypothetical protein BRC86_07535 [Halobacteriales archaeon QS_3_64_16]|nr:MAG: hypothetical protein BRC86_07535 [Halobacteriales archaeon QS_3_64_16]